jgi:regulator of protease activity HflC (stomatin/prohibitin superfamily)
MRPSSAVSALVFVVWLVGCGLVGALAAFEGYPGVFPVALLVGVIGGAFLASAIRVVAEWERMVVLRLGRFSGVMEPGLRLIVPILDTPIFVDVRTQTVDIARQQTITQDNVPVLVNGVIFFKVQNAEAAALRVQSYRQAMVRLAQATLRDAVGSLTLDELLSKQEKLEEEIARSVERASRDWGLHVESIKLEDIDVPEDLKKMMSRQASSEREKRATIIKAEGDRLAADALAQAAHTMAASPGAMQLRTLQSIDGLGPSASNTVVLALPIEFVEALRAYTGSTRRAAGDGNG